MRPILLVLFLFTFFSCNSVSVSMKDVALIPKETAAIFINNNINKDFSSNSYREGVLDKTSVTQNTITSTAKGPGSGTWKMSEVYFRLYKYDDHYYLVIRKNGIINDIVCSSGFSEGNLGIAKKLAQALVSLEMEIKE